VRRRAVPPGHRRHAQRRCGRRLGGCLLPGQVGVLVTRRNGLVAVAPGRQDPPERVPKLGVEDGVDDRVESGVGVAKPR